MKAIEYYGTALCQPGAYAGPDLAEGLLGLHPIGNLARKFIKARGIKSLETIVDLGAGPGTGSVPFLNGFGLKRCIRVDASPEMLEFARQIIREETIQFIDIEADFQETQLGIESGSVCAVIACYAMPFISKHEFVFAEISRILRPGGFFAFDALFSKRVETVNRICKAELCEPEYFILPPRFLDPIASKYGFEETLDIPINKKHYMRVYEKNLD